MNKIQNNNFQSNQVMHENKKNGNHMHKNHHDDQTATNEKSISETVDKIKGLGQNVNLEV